MASLESIFYHMVLPPNLPGRPDPDVDTLAHALVARLERACETITSFCDGSECARAVLSLRHSLRICDEINRGHLHKASMLRLLPHLKRNRVIVLYVVEQNATLLVRRSNTEGAETVIFEAFETSPRAKDVLAAGSALQWDFSGCASAIPWEIFLDGAFQEALATFLEQASLEPLERFAAHVTKAGVSVTEARDTTNPALITQMLMSLLTALGSSADVSAIHKRVRDDVNFGDAEHPWRRLPFWLALRIASQRQLELDLGPIWGRKCYKLLVCVTLSQLLEDCAGRVDPHMSTTLRAKLCRRLAKLETEKDRNAAESVVVYDDLFDSLRPFFKSIIRTATAKVDTAWNVYRQSTTRSIPKLPQHADDGSLHLSLPNSGRHLEQIVQSHKDHRTATTSGDALDDNEHAAEGARTFVRRYFELAQLEYDIEQRQRPQIASGTAGRVRCIALATRITNVFEALGDAYEADAGQMSMFILNLFDLWREMDECAVQVCPLLRDYHPTFCPELLDVLQLPTLVSMRRLADLQGYLKDRCDNCRYGAANIFSGSRPESFATRYVAECEELQSLQDEIEDASNQGRRLRQSAWEKACRDYDERTQQISESICICSWNDDGTRNVHGCKKCWHWRYRNRIKVTAHEDFLPRDPTRRSEIVFELGMPTYLLAYRDATWRMVRDLRVPKRPITLTAPVLLLKEHDKLRQYIKSAPRLVSMASHTKSFLQTHYKDIKMKVDLKSVLLPHGAQYSLYDLESGLWIHELANSLTLQHLCGIHVPRALDPDLSGTPPSSYEIVVSQTECPPEMSVHEFLAYQGLISARARRWPSILVELGSPNLNFSGEDTVQVITQLAVQAGPQRRPALLRDIHSIFQEEAFRHRLTEQIDRRLGSISSSWREAHCMEMLITLTLRLLTLTTDGDTASTQRLLRRSRDVTLAWISRLRQDIRLTIEADTASTMSMYALRAGLLCRRTFTPHVEDDSLVLDADGLDAFVQASVAIQENLVMDPGKLPPAVKRMFIRDVKMAYSLRTLIKQSLQVHPDTLSTAIPLARTTLDHVNHTFRPWKFLVAPDENWMSSSLICSMDGRRFSQIVRYNFVEGHLLVDGRPIGRLPPNLSDSEDVKELFGNRQLLTYPSLLPNMTHKLTDLTYGNEVHFGTRDNRVVIRTLGATGLLEYVPRQVFTAGETRDLPSSLIDTCTHWLNIRSNCLEIRRKPSIWRTRRRDWIVDITKRRASRGSVSLVDPHSDLGRRVAQLFQHFESPARVTVFQPVIGKLSVELRHLELSFFVNKHGLLQCRELGAQIDPNQDAGTLYGLQSKIVMRDVHSRGHRSIIFPLGSFSWTRRGMHVAVRVSSSNEYGKFEIDSVLGRLTCAAEPRLLYSKALCHALTSFVLPDPLTGRTGAEEALTILRSGRAQPWSPLGSASVEILRAIAMLSPRREYYPKDKRSLQKTAWDCHLTPNIQHDCYEATVQHILDKSYQLEAFVSNREPSPDVHLRSHLRKRGELHCRLYERSHFDERDTADDKRYPAEDREKMSTQAAQVYQVTKLLLAQPFRVNSTRSLRHILEAWGDIGSFTDSPQLTSYCLSDLIQTKMSEQWGTLMSVCRKTDVKSSYTVMFQLAVLCFGPRSETALMESLVATARLEDLKMLSPPPHCWFTGFQFRAFPSVPALETAVRPAYLAFKAVSKKKARNNQEAARNDHQLRCQAEGRRFAQFIVNQWPHEAPLIEDFESSVIDKRLALERILPLWQNLHRNWALSDYIEKIERALEMHTDSARGVSTMPLCSFRSSGPGIPIRTLTPPRSEDLVVSLSSCTSISICPSDGLITSNCDGRRLHARRQQERVGPRAATAPKELTVLRRIICGFTESDDASRRRYGDYLEKSLTALCGIVDQTEFSQVPSRRGDIANDLNEAEISMYRLFDQIRSAFSTDDSRSEWLQLGQMWPAVTPTTVLELLRSTSVGHLLPGWKKALIFYGIATTAVQRLHRIEHMEAKGGNRHLLEEWRNPGHENWNPVDFPDWLLLEIDNNFLIRREQVDVCHAIVSPVSGTNSVLQMNMGKGKTSCVVPMAVSLLADKNHLSRLIVPKALLFQTAQMIQSRLGGLVGREARHVPFSRRTPTTSKMLGLYRALHETTRASAGLMLTTPEHILSYKLSGLQMLADSKFDAAREMIQFQSTLTATCRDVLDESDFTLAVKTQLIYPSGDRVPVDGNPHRWEIAQALLSLVEDHLPTLEATFPNSIEIVRRSQGYPFIHFLRSDVEDALTTLITNDVCDGRCAPMRLDRQALQAHQTVLRKALSDELLDLEDIILLVKECHDQDSAAKRLLLVRGVLKNRILLLCLKKRWNVQYGLHPGRQPVAVPFDAKGVPAEQSEFGHPDVAITFTCLSFYYSGLTLVQFRDSLSCLSKSADPATEYDRWTHLHGALPEALRHWNIINIEDHGQVEALWQHLRWEKHTLDYHMNNFVFPTHAKQFSVKLQASGWDIPLMSANHRDDKSVVRTTGFSGTNDNRTMLPLTIRQDDIPGLLHTNAEVLSYLLHDRNRGYHVAASQGRRLTEEELIQRVARMQIRILIDAGAYVLGLDNQSVVKLWLEKEPKAKAAVFFGSDNRAWVQFRGGKEKVPLVATPYLDDLEECLVYIDEAHTRGVDLKLPRSARGALTLALGQTKDHTVQAAMRLRQLGTTQSVVFFAPTEVHHSILDVCKPGPGESIDSSHVITWLLEQTCRTNDQLQGLYLAQGFDFCRRMDAQWKSAGCIQDDTQRAFFLDVIQLQERKTLQQLYGGARGPSTMAINIDHPRLESIVQELDRRNQDTNSKQTEVQSSVLEEVEQEREVFLEVEEVRTVKKPVRHESLSFPGLHASISRYTATGVLSGGTGYENAFVALARTNIGRKYGVRGTRSRLFISKEFMRTVATSGRSQISADDFLRPVEWILWSPSTETALIVIPEEAECLLPAIRKLGRKTRVHLIAYAAPITRSMLHFNDLSYYALPTLPPAHIVPTWLSTDLGIFAGRLYLGFKECAVMRRYLRQPVQEDSLDEGVPLIHETFCDRPVDFLLEWLALRRKTWDITHTPMGYICQDRHLPESHPFFAQRPNSEKDDVQARQNIADNWNRPHDEEIEDDADSDHADEVAEVQI